MARYIDADALSLEVRRYLMPNVDVDGTVQVEDAERYFLNRIDKAPTADVEKVRHGEWIKKNGIYVCSECDFTCPYDVVGDNIEYWECLYCPHCRAKMDGGK